MFAGRQEQHTLNVQQLVRINKLNQLNQGSLQQQDDLSRDLGTEESKFLKLQQNLGSKDKDHVEIQQNQSPSAQSEENGINNTVHNLVEDSQYHHNHNLSSSNQNSIYQLASKLSLKEKDFEDYPFTTKDALNHVELVNDNSDSSNVINQQESFNSKTNVKIQRDASVALIILNDDHADSKDNDMDVNAFSSVTKPGQTTRKINQNDVKGIVSNESDLLKILFSQRSNQQANEEQK